MRRRPRVLVLEFTTGAPGEGWYDRHVKLPNYLGVMPQSVAVWAEDLGGDVTYRTYTGAERPADLLAGEWDVAFLSAYTRAAYSAYAAAFELRSRGTVTALGGPHAMAYPGDAQAYFDYVLGLTDRNAVARVLEERTTASSPGGRWISADRHPVRLPPLRRRATYLDVAFAKTRFVRVVPLLASIGCPYTCDFCSDARTEFQPLALTDVQDDVDFALERYPGALLFWMDPTFGIQFDPLLAAIERGARGRPLRFGAETTLSLLTRDRLAALARAGCEVLMPGIESWGGYEAKLGRAARQGRERVRHVAARIEEILSFVPYVQVNFVLGLDGTSEPETFELTSEFLRLVPGVWPSLNLVTAWGVQSPLSVRLHEEGRILPVPLPLLDQKSCSNVRRSSGSHEGLYRSVLQIEDEAFGLGASARRVAAGRGWGTRIVNALRARGSEMRRRRRWHRMLVDGLASDGAMRAFFDGERVPIPKPLRERALLRTGPFVSMLPPAIVEELRAGLPRAVGLEPLPLQPMSVPALPTVSTIGSRPRSTC